VTVASADKGDRERLERRLKKLAGFGTPQSGSGREIGPGDPRALLSALLTEVDETVLARRLGFRHADDRPELRIDVYGRRLTGLVSPAPRGLPAAQAALFGRALEDEDAPALHALLDGWLAGASDLWVVSEPAAPDRDPLAMGVAARWLADQWKLRLDSRPLPTEAAALDALARVPALAWLRRDAAGSVTTHGADADLERLRALPAPGSSAQPHCTALGGEPGDQVLVLAQAAGESLCMLVRRGDLAAVARAWRSVIR
jgi:hypothetical protein